MYWSLPGSSCSETCPNPSGTLALPQWASALLSVKRGAWAGRAQAGHGTALPAASAVLLVGPQSPADLPHVSSSQPALPVPQGHPPPSPTGLSSWPGVQRPLLTGEILPTLP